MTSKRGKNSETVAILANACANNLPLDLRVVGSTPTEEYRSRFLAMSDTAKQPILIIEAPTSKGSVIPVRSGQEVRISFSHHSGSRLFVSRVHKRGNFILNPQTTVLSLELLVPETIESGGRRGFYRLPTDTIPPIEVALGILAKTKTKPGRVRSREKAIVTDLGGGGLGFRIPEGKSLLLGPDTPLLLQLRLPDDDEEIKLLARVCFSLRRPELREAFFGVQFIDVDSTIEYKQGVDKILRFVADAQRKHLSERASP